MRVRSFLKSFAPSPAGRSRDHNQLRLQRRREGTQRSPIGGAAPKQGSGTEMSLWLPQRNPVRQMEQSVAVRYIGSLRLFGFFSYFSIVTLLPVNNRELRPLLS